ncbi:L10-interacting MYB domain-containing protein-like [Pistacia vera]|uniref:L10-interacting MYB domain-containing protein-like n=1 Tax=Pistacia vera TaxID=55513 RepID=UPI001262F6A6|nr:L10-interacting MYB domain-containing protein-like [Pistacia vera]
MTNKFLVLLSERAKTSHSTSIKTTNYQDMLDDLSSLGGRRLNLTQLASKYFRLRKVYQAWRKLIQHTGFGWDHESQTPTCPIQVWQEYIKQNPQAQQFFHDGLPHKELYEVIFEKQTTIGRYAYTSTSQPVENCTSSNQGLVEIDDSDFEPDLDGTTGEKRSNTSGHARSRNRRKRRQPRTGTCGCHWQIDGCACGEEYRIEG